MQRAIRAKEITAEQLVQLYFKRIAAYNGTCVKGEIDPATGLMLGEITPIENAGQLNAYMTLNIRGKRSKTDPADNDPKMLDALETARAQDAYFARTGNFVGPLHGIPVAVKDNYDTADMRTTAGAFADYANDKPPQDATMVAKLRAAGAIILGKTNLDEYAPAGIGRSTLGGQTCNPYDTKRITGGSSAGSAAAVAANLADLRARHRYLGVGALSVVAQCAGRNGRDAGAGEPCRHRAADVLTRPGRPDVPHRRGYGGDARSAHRR